MEFPFSIIEVFNQPEKGFRGNTAAVVLLSNPLSGNEMRLIAQNMLQPATTFLWPANGKGHYHVRWFAPDNEIGLCGHGALAALAFLNKSDIISLQYQKGVIKGSCGKDQTATFELDAIPVLREEPIPKVIEKGLGIPVKGYFVTSNKQIILTESEELVKNMKPDFNQLRKSEVFGYAITAPGREVDFVSRTLVPHVHQLEDPATGSSHAALTPFWAKRTGKSTFTSHQLSTRGGVFHCIYTQNKVQLSGGYTLLAQGTLYHG